MQGTCHTIQVVNRVISDQQYLVLHGVQDEPALFPSLEEGALLVQIAFVRPMLPVAQWKALKCWSGDWPNKERISVILSMLSSLCELGGIMCGCGCVHVGVHANETHFYL